MTNEEAFYRFWQSMSALSSFEEFPFDQFDEEDFVLAEAMISEGLTRLMEFKTQLLNAKHELQTSNLQRGVLPQTEKRKEGVCAETLSDKETLSALFRSKELNGRNYPKLHGEGESYIQDYSETDKANIGQAKSATFRLQGFEEGFFGAKPNL